MWVDQNICRERRETRRKAKSTQVVSAVAPTTSHGQLQERGTRNERRETREKMHHIAAKSNLVDSIHETDNDGFGLPLCPKPRRVRPAIPNFLVPLRCAHRIHSQSSGDARSGILNIIAGKNVEGRDCLCSNCYPSCYSGSPPRRTENPLVHDVYFVHQMELHSPFSRTKLSEKFSMTSASPT